MMDHHPVKFDGYRSCSSRDILDLVCQLILKEHVTKGSRSFIGKSPSRYLTILLYFGVRRHSSSRDNIFDLKGPRNQRIM